LSATPPSTTISRLYVDGAVYLPNVHYTVSGTTLTLTGAPFGTFKSTMTVVVTY
jgi:hypothetical protein